MRLLIMTRAEFYRKLEQEVCSEIDVLPTLRNRLFGLGLGAVVAWQERRGREDGSQRSLG